MEALSYSSIDSATEVIVHAFEADPVWTFCFPLPLARRVCVYSMFAAQLMCGINLRSTRVTRNEDGKIAGVAIFEDERLNPLLLMLGYLSQSLVQFPLMWVKLARDVFGSCNPLTFVLAIPISVPFFVVYWPCYFFFAINFMRAALAGSGFVRKDGWNKQKKKNLLAIGTLPTEQGKGVGSKLLGESFAELEAEKFYGGYYVESSNPRNVRFYERNGFEKLGEAKIMGLTLTYLVRPDQYRPRIAADP